MKEALEMELFSLKRLSAEGLWEGFFTGNPGRYVKALDLGISLQWGPFMSEGNLESRVGACVPVTLNDE